MSKKPQDTIYADPLQKVADFTFDERVTRVFPDMIKRSVPGYETIVSNIGSLAAPFVADGGRCYDLGCSLGASTLSLRHYIPAGNTRIISVDSSVEMINRCRELIALDTATAPVELICADIREVPITDASVVILNFTLQFIPVEERRELLLKIYHGLRKGGILILSEKIAFSNAALQQLMTEKHHNFKRANGYSDLEISQKRTALENVMAPETIHCHQQRLSDIGFSCAEVWFQCLNFASMIAIK